MRTPIFSRDSHPTSKLPEFDGITTERRTWAMWRFDEALKQALGSESTAARAYRAWRAASNVDRMSIDLETANLATAWLQAVDLARDSARYEATTYQDLPGNCTTSQEMHMAETRITRYG
ncbi:hypothetical protein [Xylophilus sp. GOD-11R]|uniref:hypothetical protein n=1 Tax=Xylophilus sp. GOD-11R TaxID=3089814 RepID=UPI00298C271E|nr:hypothetical protein [Xylophilus sp. GOD-11R]WPB58024.1 hypothetical protein R9X41_05115 [Xylophilus sp. GOD-11R]